MGNAEQRKTTIRELIVLLLLIFISIGWERLSLNYGHKRSYCSSPRWYVSMESRKSAPVSLCPPQIPRGLTRARNWVSAVRSMWLTAWAIARPSETLESEDITDWNTNLVEPNRGWKWNFMYARWKSVVSFVPHLITAMKGLDWVDSTDILGELTKIEILYQRETNRSRPVTIDCGRYLQWVFTKKIKLTLRTEISWEANSHHPVKKLPSLFRNAKAY
jgi:hypothetical protein